MKIMLFILPLPPVWPNTSKKFAENILKRNRRNGMFVVEIGSNDGIMFKHFAKRGIKHLGIEPSSNVAEVAIAKGINTITEFFDEKVADKIIEKYGKADFFLGANVMCHIPYIHSVIAGIKKNTKTKRVVNI